VTSPDTVTRLATSVAITRWLAGIEFPAVAPLPVDQPVTSQGCAVTFWRYLPQHLPEPGPADLGHLLRRLHQLEPPPVPLPAYRPLASLPRRIEASHAISDDDRAWLLVRCPQLVRAYHRLSFPLPAGMIHGDAWRGNLLRGQNRVVLADWDAVSTGPRETDLIPTLQAPGSASPARSATRSSPPTATTSDPGTATRSCATSGNYPPSARSFVTATPTQPPGTNCKSGSDPSALATTVSGHPSDAQGPVTQGEGRA
jgi:Phosphotransferase enzyme family